MAELRLVEGDSMNIKEILSLKFPHVNFLKDVILRDHGDGKIEIAEWNLADPQPTQVDLDRWAIELDLPYRQQLAVDQRVYPSLQEQLDLQYNDVKNKTTTWIDTISAIKAAFPKPTV